MIDESTHELASLHALSALTPEETREFEARLRGDAELTALVEDLREASALLAYSAEQVDPPFELKQRILAAAAADKAASQPAPTHAPRRQTKSTFIPWAAAAAFAILAGILWSNNQLLLEDSRELATQRTVSEKLYSQLAALEQETQAKSAALAGLESQVTTLRAQAGRLASLEQTIKQLQERNALAEMKVATLTSQVDASYLASVVWDRDSQKGILHVRRLPEAESGKDYQLWVIDPKVPVPVSAGVFRVQPDGSAEITFAPAKPVSNAQTFAVSVEKQGGAPAPEGPIVLAN